MAKLFNINDLKTNQLDYLTNELTGNVFIELFNDQMYLTTEGSEIFNGSTNKLRKIINTTDNLSQTYSKLFGGVAQNLLSNYFKNSRNNENICGLCLNDDLLFNKTKNLKWFQAIEICSNNIPEYFIIEKNIKNSFRIVYFLDLKLSGLYSIIEEHLKNFVDYKPIVLDKIIGSDYIYNISGVDIKSGLRKTISISSKLSNLDKNTTNQAPIFNQFSKNGLIIPNIFNFVFNFNDTSFADDKDDYRAYFSKTFTSDTVELDYNQIIFDYRLPKNILDFQPADLNSFVVENDRTLTAKSKIVLPKHPKIKSFLRTKNKMYKMDVEQSTLKNIYLMTDKFNFGEIYGFEGLINIKNPSIIKEKIYSNIKLSLFSSNTPIFSNSDYISFQSELLKSNNRRDLIEWRLYASDIDDCNCIKNKNGCFQPGYISKFESSNIVFDTKGYEITVDDYIELAEGESIYFTTYTGFCGVGEIYKIRNSFKNNKTKFNLYTTDIDDNYAGGNMVFEYYQKPFNYTFFNRNGNPETVAKNIQAAIFLSFVDKNFPVDCVVEDNSLIFMNKYPQNNFHFISMNYRLHPKTSLNNFRINDDYIFTKKEVGDTSFKFGNVEFTGSHASNTPMSFVIKKDDKVTDEYDFVLTKQGMKEINKYKFNNANIKHFNYIIDGELIDGYYGYCVENINRNNDFYLKDNSLFLSKRFKPQILNLQII